MCNDTILPFDFPVVGRKKLIAAFDGGRITSDGGVLLLGMVERRLGIAAKLAGLIADPRNPALVTHSVDDILRARILAIACGYEDADDLDHLRTDPAFKLACQRRRENASAGRRKNASGTSTGCPLGLPVFGQLGGVFWRRDSASGWHNQSRPIAMRSMASPAKRYVTQSGLIGPVKVGLPEIMLRLGNPPPRRSRRADAACFA